MADEADDADDTDDAFDAELADAAEVEARLCADNSVFAPIAVHVTFASDDKKKLVALGKALTAIGYRVAAPAREEDGYVSIADAPPLPIAEGSFVALVADLLCRAEEFDCMLAGYDAPTSGAAAGDRPSDLEQPGAHYFAGALAAFERGNRGLAIALFTQALAVEPENPNTWYSRACIEDMIDLSERARRDYDKAIELAPRFVSALVNRGANKDAAGEHDAAIADYDRALAIDKTCDAAYLNRGNSKFNKDDRDGAIADWKLAAGLGSATAKQRLAKLRV